MFEEQKGKHMRQFMFEKQKGKYTRQFSLESKTENARKRMEMHVLIYA